MIFDVLINKVDTLTDLMGTIWFELGNMPCRALYYDLNGYAQSHFLAGKMSTIDLWLLDGLPKIALKKHKGISISSYTTIYGQIDHYFNTHEFRVDCGEISMDVSCDDKVDIAVGSYVAVKGTLQAFLPGVEGLSKEAIWFTYG